jgi:hypothetical protein
MMDRIGISIVLLFSIIAMSGNSYSKDKFPALENRYLGQKLPGLHPVLFRQKNILKVRFCFYQI